jgi:hypothetical protein
MIGFSSLFRALSLKLRIVVTVGGIAAVLAGYGLWHHRVFNSGWNAAIAAIAAQDRRAIDAARSARAHWRACVDSDGVWNASTGQCRRR